MEKKLPKHKIIEIYMNAIEYGPSIVGINHASKFYFDKPPKELNSSESAFLALLLPSPHKRYKHLCNGYVSNSYRNKIQRLLNQMKRSSKNFEPLPLATSLVFSSKNKYSPICRRYFAKKKSPEFSHH